MGLNVIFDMDGVLVDSELHWTEIQSDFLRGLLPKWTDEDQLRLIGLSANHVYELLVKDYGLGQSIEEYFSYYEGITKEIYGKRTQLIPRVENLLHELRDNGIPLALASSSPHAWISIVLDRFGFRDLFEHVVSADDLGGVGKPHPGIYLKTSELLEVAPSECIAIEDSNKGVASAVAAGMTCVGIKNGFNEHQDLSQADVVIEGFSAINAEFFRGLYSEASSIT
jgi:HAD superfamily hydrolase (TIGR01509 family)